MDRMALARRLEASERNAARLGFQLSYVRVALVKPGPGLVPSP